MFAVALSLVLLISTAVLLYQFWTRALVEPEAGAAKPLPRPRVDAVAARPQRPHPVRTFHIDHAA